MWTRTSLKIIGIQTISALLAILLFLSGPVVAGGSPEQVSEKALPETSPAVSPAKKDLPTLDLVTRGGLTPYLGAGIDDAEDNPDALDKEEPSVQVGAGVKFGLDSSTTFNLGYRGTLAPLPELQESLDTRRRPGFEGHSITFGLEKAF